MASTFDTIADGSGKRPQKFALIRSQNLGMSERPRRRRGPLLWLADRSRQFWIVTALALPVAYLASFGPACWMSVRARSEPACRRIGEVYWPLLWIGMNTAWGISPVKWYMSLGAPDDAPPYMAHDTGIGYRIGWKKIDPSPDH
jgi:hypothetical protein